MALLPDSYETETLPSLQAARLLSSLVSTRRRTSVQISISVYTLSLAVFVAFLMGNPTIGPQPTAS